MAGDPFTDPEITESDIARAVGVANDHIEAAEEILWATAGRTDAETHASEIEAVTRDIWEIQNKLVDIQQEID